MPNSSPSLDTLEISILSTLSTAFFQALPALIVAAALVLGSFAAVFLGRRLVRKLQFGEESRERIAKAWVEVEQHVADGDETHLRMAVIKADAVLDMALQAKMFPGKTLNERLRFATYKYRNLRRVRWAHGLRNTLAHEPMKRLSRRDGQAAVAAFKAALRELGAL